MTEILNTLLGVGTIVLQALSLVIIYTLITKRETPISLLIKKYALLASFNIILLGMIASLVYSSVIGYEPCTLCWYARIALYPQAILFGIALWYKDTRVLIYTQALSIIGMIITGYHTFIVDFGGTSILPCSAEVSCATRYVFAFGYVTIPLMAFSSFLVLFLIGRLATKSST